MKKALEKNSKISSSIQPLWSAQAGSSLDPQKNKIDIGIVGESQRSIFD